MGNKVALIITAFEIDRFHVFGGIPVCRSKKNRESRIPTIKRPGAATLQAAAMQRGLIDDIGCVFLFLLFLA